MKKTAIIFLCLFGMALNTSAQFRLLTTGHAYIGEDDPMTEAVLTVGMPNMQTSYPHYSFGALTFPNPSVPNSTSYYYIGLGGRSQMSGVTCNIGVQGMAANSSSRNFGVLGGLSSTTSKGAGIFGTLDNSLGFYMSGRYAGYFDGPTMVDGTLTAGELVTPSDLRLKENIVTLRDEEKGERTLAKLMDLDVIHYDYKKRMVRVEEDSIDSDLPKQIVANEWDKSRHYGLVAQQLQDMYPDLVREGQDGYLGVNYIEMVPILIHSIQELKNELDEVRGLSTARKKAMETSVEGIANAAPAKEATLFRNTPNPFSTQTEISFFLPDDARNSYIYIFDMQGKMIKRLSVNPSMQSITIGTEDLTAGIYLYSLAVDGQEIDTRRMIVSK